MAHAPLPFTEPLSPMRTGIAGRCPRCGKGHLFEAFLRLAPRCDQCGQDFSFADPADGPAFFVMSFTSFLSVAVGFVVQAAFGAPVWLTLAIAVVLTLVVSLALLRPVKGWLVNSQYFYKAGEGVLAAPIVHGPCGCESCKALAAKRLKVQRR